MTGSALYIILSFASLFSQFVFSSQFSILSVFPKFQEVNEYHDVVIDCTDEDGGEVVWFKLNSTTPKRIKQVDGRLKISNIKRTAGGTYVCMRNDGKYETAVVKVIPKSSKFPLTEAATFRPLTQSYQFTTGSFFTTFGVTNSPYPCLYGVCNGTCCKSDSAEVFFDCANGQKINKSLVCNRENDCDDGSDESECAPWPPKLIVLPKQKVEVYCGDQDKKNLGTLTLECASVGHPTPLVRWKKYEGHVPSKCQQYSKRGHGILTCPDFQQSDQGAYSCVAENLVQAAESQPKTIAKCSNTINCQGFRVVDKEKIEHCLECFCSGRTTSCQNIKSSLTVIKIPFPESKTEVFVEEDGKVLFVPTKREATPTYKVRQSSEAITYCSFTENELQEKSLIKSFGRSIIIPRYSGKTDFLQKAPLLIIQSNALSLMYTANVLSPLKDSKISIRFWPGNWHHLNKEAANRIDLMKVLSNIQGLFIRCEYEQGSTVSWSKNSTVFIESSIITHLTDSVSYIEKCHCPPGYDGLSCETCAQGYKKKLQDESFVCEKIFVPVPCKPGYTGPNCSLCDTASGYIRRENVCEKPLCHPDGSISLFPLSSGVCLCKKGVTGKYCDECQRGYFHLNRETGCRKCWCSDVTDQCKSSKLYRTIVSNIPRGGYNYSDGKNFWLLPPDFSGNRLTSYGGFFNYTLKYKPNIPKQKTLLAVEFLSMEDVSLSYTHTTLDTSVANTEKSWSVPLTEVGWKKVDKTDVSRGEFLKMLSRIKALYIESPYHLSSYQVNVTSILMTSASPNFEVGNPLALEVEECDCPPGYTGLSCESCSKGYYKKRNGTMSMCIKCNCTYCDPDFGCPQCPQLQYRDNPETEKLPVCKPCPCQKNGVSCYKDDFGQIFCRCKPGFRGMHCQDLIPEETDELTIRISPRMIKGKKVGAVVLFNCTVLTNEEMVLSAKKYDGTPMLTLLNSVSSGSKPSKQYGKEISKTFEVTLNEGLKSVECFVHDAQGKLAGHAIAVVTGLMSTFEPVEITNCDSDHFEVKESESKDLICEATGSPKPLINWYRAVNGSKPEKIDTSEGVHTIETASLSLNGSVYSCIAENSRGDKAICTRILIVKKKCEVVNIIPGSVKTQEGKNISLECKTTAKSSVTWTKLTAFGTETSFFSPNVKVIGGSLHITGATISNTGTYICSAVGQTGKINDTVSLVVEEKKELPSVFIQEYDKTLKIGDSFEVHCVVKGKPTPTVTWKKLKGVLDSNVQQFGKTLKITKARLTNTGIYACEAVSPLGNASSHISIDVKYDFIPPKVNISKEIISAFEGEEVNVTCLAIGYPLPEVNFYAPNISFTKLARVYHNMVLIEPNEAEKMEVSFKMSKEMEGLKLICSAKNSAGEDEVAAKIKVYQRKVESVNETVELAAIGTYFELTCEFEGNITWNKKGSLVGDECPIPNGLMIRSVQIQHNGTYICKAGLIIKKIIHLRVVGFVPKFSKASKSYLVIPMQSNKTIESRVELTFRATNENGFLLQKERQFDIYLYHKKIYLRVFGVAEDFIDIEMKESIHLWKWYTLVVTFGNNIYDITIYNELMNIHERKTELTRDFKTKVDFHKNSFFLGGPGPNGKNTQRNLPRHSLHFDGCISRLIVSRHEFDIVKEGSYSNNVTLCNRCSEEWGPSCGETGICLDAPTQYGFICVCPKDGKKGDSTCAKSCVKKGCETGLDFCTLLNPCKGGFLRTCENLLDKLNCNCPQGYSGITCEKALEYSFCSDGNGYVRLPSNLLARIPGIPEEIKMSFTLYKPSGQLLWQGNAQDHLSISVHQGKLKYTYLNQRSKLEVQGGSIETEKKYVIFVRRVNSTVTIEIDPKEHILSSKQTLNNSIAEVHTSRVSGDIYLGLIPNSVFFLGQSAGLNGCIHYIAFEDKGKINLPEKALESINVSSPRKPYIDENSDESEDYSNNEIDYGDSE